MKLLLTCAPSPHYAHSSRAMSVPLEIFPEMSAGFLRWNIEKKISIPHRMTTLRGIHLQKKSQKTRQFLMGTDQKLSTSGRNIMRVVLGWESSDYLKTSTGWI